MNVYPVTRKGSERMNHRVERVIKSRVAIMVAIGFIASIVLSGLPYASMRNILVSPSHAHAAGLNPIQVENSKAGTPSWDDFASDLAPDTISGFGSKISVNHGDSLDLYVTTIAPSFTIDVFRTGYYGGAGARLITSLGSFPGL